MFWCPGHWTKKERTRFVATLNKIECVKGERCSPSYKCFSPHKIHFFNDGFPHLEVLNNASPGSSRPFPRLLARHQTTAAHSS